jgi:hypothetical protein
LMLYSRRIGQVLMLMRSIAKLLPSAGKNSHCAIFLH